MKDKKLNVVLIVIILILMGFLTFLTFKYVNKRHVFDSQSIEEQKRSETVVNQKANADSISKTVTILLNDLGNPSEPFYRKVKHDGVVDWENQFTEPLTLIFEDNPDDPIIIPSQGKETVTMSKEGRFYFYIKENPSIDGTIYVVK
ncbi:MAG: hypothetical protein ACOCXQ_00290 [Patescibacteria group bacterium]